jgi:hypothetical protein
MPRRQNGEQQSWEPRRHDASVPPQVPMGESATWGEETHYCTPGNGAAGGTRMAQRGRKADVALDTAPLRNLWNSLMALDAIAQDGS